MKKSINLLFSALLVLSLLLTACSSQGPQGVQGPQGAQGIQGERGEKGDQGPQGEQGIQGEKGDKGDTGAQGAQGEQGIQGEKGNVGEQGVQGEAGNGILKVEIIDGCLWITYTNDPETPINIGALDPEQIGTEGLAYYPLPDGTYGVAAGTTLYLEEVEIPAVYNGKAVTQILPGAFKDSTSLVSITLPNSITKIGEKAFYGCKALTSIEIPDNVTGIGDQAFGQCSNLTNVIIGEGVTSIGIYAFVETNNLSSVTFKNPNGWWVCYPTPDQNVEAVNIPNPSSAAIRLSSIYTRYYWIRRN